MDLTCYVRRPTKRSSPLDERRSIGESTIELSGEAMRLIVALDGKVILQELPAKYPRVLNRIAAAWNSPSEAERCFNDLLLHCRGTRQGFPQPVINELVALKQHFFRRVFPKIEDPWDQAFLR
jgi:hypothetical protein